MGMYLPHRYREEKRREEAGEEKPWIIGVSPGVYKAKNVFI